MKKITKVVFFVLMLVLVSSTAFSQNAATVGAEEWALLSQTQKGLVMIGYLMATYEWNNDLLEQPKAIWDFIRRVQSSPLSFTPSELVALLDEYYASGADGPIIELVTPLAIRAGGLRE